MTKKEPDVQRALLGVLLAALPALADAQMLGASLISTSAGGVVSATSIYAATISAGTYTNAIPSGLIAAFASTSCPTGWSEYTAARGRFLRGIDNGAGNDPNGTRSPGGTQADAFQGFKPHWGAGGIGDGSPLPFGSAGGSYLVPWHASGTGQAAEWSLTSDGTNGSPRTSSETRPKNVAVLFCQKD